MSKTSLFQQCSRASGVALDVAALPSRYGIGDVGPAALRWIDRLCDAGQTWWHAFGFCTSVYQTHSSFAGSALVISPDWLIEEGLLTPTDCDCVSFPTETIDYDVVVPFKHWLLEKAWNKFNSGARKDLFRSYEQFRKKQAHWLEDYAMFQALKLKYRGAHHREWPLEVVRREPSAIAAVRKELTTQIDQVRFSQFIFSRQTKRLKEYAHARGVRLIGDLPCHVCDDSSEVWASPELFVSEATEGAAAPDLIPMCISSRDRLGPVKDPGAVSRVSHRWCVDRLRALLAHVDAARVDVPASAAPRHATVGAPANRTTEDPGGSFLSDGCFIPQSCASERNHADSRQVLETRALQLAFDGSSLNPHLPQNYGVNSVAYTCLSDHPRTREWFEALPEPKKQLVWDFLRQEPVDAAEVSWELIRLAWSSNAALAMVTLPDLLNLGSEKTPLPGRADGHCRWRCSEEMLSTSAFYWLRELTRDSNRSIEVKKSARLAPRRSSRAQRRIQAVL